MELKQTIESFIRQSSEGSYWDFKQCWHEDNVDLLKDIICMANNTTVDMHDGYIIFGVEDKTYKIIGVSEDSNRKNKENIINFLSSKSWFGEEIPDVDVKTIKIDGKEIDVLIICNHDVTPYYLLQDYSKSTAAGKNKAVLRAGVIYSRIGDRNTSSAECATKQAAEFLWKKRFGLIGSDEFKVIKRLQNVDSWYSTDEYDTLFNKEYSDIRIEKDRNYIFEEKINQGKAETGTLVMDFPYLFTSIVNWNIGKEETVQRAKWDIFLNDRKLDISICGVQATKQTYYHIEPNMSYLANLGIYLNEFSDHIQYYLQNSIEYLAYKLFFTMQCYKDDQKYLNKAFTVIPVFENEQEHDEFIEYVKKHKDKFKSDVETQSIEEMFPFYTQTVNTAIVYKLGKTLVEWLDNWKHN